MTPLKSLSFIFFVLMAFIPAIGQKGYLRGTVVDSKTFKPLPFASVYINNTTIGSFKRDTKSGSGFENTVLL